MYKTLKTEKNPFCDKQLLCKFFESSVIWPFVGNFTRRVPITRSEHGKTPDSERILKRNQDTILEQNGLQTLSVYYESL